MRPYLSIPLCVMMLSFGGSASAQEATGWVSAEWMPVSDENERLFKEAEDKFKAAVEEEREKHKAEGREGHHRPEGADGPPEGGRGGPPGGGMGGGGMGGGGMGGAPGGGGMGGPHGGGMGGHHGGRGMGGPGMDRPPGPPSLEQMLPVGLEFAAPTSGGLVVQRTRTSVIFGRTDSDEVVYIPLSGETDLANGGRASVQDEAGQLHLTVTLPTGQQVQYRYHKQSNLSDQVMGVDISIGARFLPGGELDFKRIYRRSEVRVGNLKKADG